MTNPTDDPTAAADPDQIYEDAIAAARREVQRRVKALPVDMNVESSVPDTLIAELSDGLTLPQVQSWLLSHDGDGFKVSSNAQGVRITVFAT